MNIRKVFQNGEKETCEMGDYFKIDIFQSTVTKYYAPSPHRSKYTQVKALLTELKNHNDVRMVGKTSAANGILALQISLPAVRNELFQSTSLAQAILLTTYYYSLNLLLCRCPGYHFGANKL